MERKLVTVLFADYGQICALADQHAVRLRFSLQPRRDVDRLARHKALAAIAGGACDDLSGVDPYPHLQAETVTRLQLDVEGT